MVRTPETPSTVETALLPALPVDLRRAAQIGAVGGLVAVFIAASGMVQAFNVRLIFDPFLALSYVALLAAPFAAGWVAGKPPPTLEGYAESPVGGRNVVAGVIAGSITGAILVLFTLLIEVVDLTSVFIKLGGQLRELLTFQLPIGTGTVLMLVAMTAVGTAGGAMHLLPQRWRRALLYGTFWAMVIGLIQVIVTQVPFMRRTPVLTRFLYSVRGGLTIPGAITVFALFFLGFFFVDRPVRQFRQRFAQLADTERRRYRTRAILISLVAALPLLIILPRLLGPFVSEVLDLAGIFLLMALGLNIVVGYAGLLDLGYVAFFAVGAYTSAILTSPLSPAWTPELTFWVAIPFILLAAAAAGLIVGTPVLRMRGDYLAIVTLGFGEIARFLALSDALKPWFGGAQGVQQVPDISVLGARIFDSVTFFPIIFAFAILFAYLSYALQDSRIGRAWIAMREDESVAEVMGVNIVAAKLSAFVIGAMFASIGGALFAHKIGSVFPESFAILVSITVVVLIIVGGMGSVPGVVVGALALVGLPELLREFQEFKFLFYGALLIFMMLKRPEGFIPSRRRARELHEEEVFQDAWLRQQEVAAGGGAPVGGK